ncbi:MAG: RNA polymerase sigma factor [Lachnospiraceae bacterium]|nr:RNA polymerase sigma factor [Lachnospiraceae bacterium]
MTITQLEQCIDCYGKEIYGFCRHITGNVQDGEDLYQDTFLKAVELADKIDVNQNPKSYLLSIAIRLWKNRSRKRAWRQRIVGAEIMNTLEELEYEVAENDTKTPEMEVLMMEQNVFVAKCVQELKERYRLPLYLYYSAELSVKEIAECMELPQGTVKSRLHKARAMIKEKLEVAGYDR